MNISSANSSSLADLNALGTLIPLAACTVNLILSFPTNGYVLWLIVTGAGGTMTTEFFTLNLTVSEILFCLSSVYVIVIQNKATNGVFNFKNFGLGFLFCGRPLFQSCICVERYLAVVHPVTFLKYKPLRYRVMSCSAVWLVVLGNCSFVAFTNYTSNDYAYLVLYLIMLSVMLFCCLSVLWALKQPGPGDRKREESNHMKTKAFKIILIILVSMVMSYLPLIVLFCIKNVLNHEVKGYSWSFVLSITVISGFVQPLLFLHRSGTLPFIRGL